MSIYRLNGAGLLLATALVGCGSSKSGATTNTMTVTGGGGDSGSDVGTTTSANQPACNANLTPTSDCPVIVPDCACDKDQRPFVFVHGTYGSGDNFAHVAALLTSNGFCPERIVAIDYNSLGASPGSDGTIDALVDKVLSEAMDSKGNPFTQVDLAGHSQGTGHCGTYMSDPTRAAKVAHYFNFSGNPQTYGVPTLSLSSMHDLGGMPHHAMGTVCTGPDTPSGCNLTEVTFQDQDHFAVAASKDSFVEVYKYLTGKMPKYTDVQCGDDPVSIAGVAETFADNVPQTGKIVVSEVGDTPRMGNASMTVMGDDKGHFTMSLKRGVAYEIAGYDASGKLIGYQYFTPFKRSQMLMRLLSPSYSGDGTSVGGLIASMSTDHATKDANSVTVVARWYGGGFRQDLGASMKINGSEVLVDANAGPGALMNSNLNGGVVGFFMEDANKNQKSDLGLVYSAPFIAFTDVYMDATTPAFINVTFTAGSEDPSTVSVPLKFSNWPSSQNITSITLQ